MLFRPHHPVFFGLIQGLIPKRKNELAENIGEAIAKNLISPEDIRSRLSDKGLEAEIARLIDEVLERRMKEIVGKHFGVFEKMMNPEILRKMRIKIRNEILSHKDRLIEAIISRVDTGSIIRDIIAKNVDNLSLDELETLTYALTARELRHIEIIGAVLGAVIGFFQYVISLYW
jgi:uncharacterized membrane protein YheB (UPF0754 family)